MKSKTKVSEFEGRTVTVIKQDGTLKLVGVLEILVNLKLKVSTDFGYVVFNLEELEDIKIHSPSLRTFLIK